MTPSPALWRSISSAWSGCWRLSGWTKCETEPLDIIGELECEDVHRDNRPEKKRGPGGGGKPGERLREPEKREHPQSPRGKYQSHQSAEKPKHVQSAATKMHVGHEVSVKKQKVRRKR